jgi:hypothetical protein
MIFLKSAFNFVVAIDFDCENVNIHNFHNLDLHLARHNATYKNQKKKALFLEFRIHGPTRPVLGIFVGSIKSSGVNICLDLQAEFLHFPIAVIRSQRFLFSAEAFKNSWTDKDTNKT